MNIKSELIKINNPVLSNIATNARSSENKRRSGDRHYNIISLNHRNISYRDDKSNHILYLTSPNSLLMLSSVNKSFRKLWMDEIMFWKTLIKILPQVNPTLPSWNNLTTLIIRNIRSDLKLSQPLENLEILIIEQFQGGLEVLISNNLKILSVEGQKMLI